MDWTQLAQGTDQWRDLVNMTKNIRIQRKTWDFLSNCDTISFQKAAAPCCVRSSGSQSATLASVNWTALAVQIAAISWQQWAVSLGFNWQRLSWQTIEHLQIQFPVSIF